MEIKNSSPRQSCSKQVIPFCPDCDPRYCTYDSHTQRKTTREPFILGDAKLFCEALYHVGKSPELGTTNHCSIYGQETDECRMQCVTMVVRVNDFVTRYTNCRRKHTEQLMAEDYILRLYLQGIKDTDMTIYLKFQPCHHSGGNAKWYPEGYLFQGKCDSRSCCEVLLRFFQEHLLPRNISLRIKIASLYKANWEFATREDDLKTVENAQLGLQLLRDHGIVLESMKINDWKWLATLTTNVSEEILLKEPTLSRRAQIDQATEKYLLKIKK